jgi:hypothetical protein
MKPRWAAEEVPATKEEVPMYRCFSLLVMVLFAVAAMPHALTVDFRAGTLPDCTDKTSKKYCPSVGSSPCTLLYVSCTGGAKKNAENCKEGKGNETCNSSSLCTPTNHASRDEGNCTQK